MKKILSVLVISSLLSAMSVATVRADEVGMSVFNPLWPVATALSIPASIIGSIFGAGVPVVVPAVPTPAPVVYAPPAPYYAPAPHYVPGAYYPRPVYVVPRGYYAPRVYYYPY